MEQQGGRSNKEAVAMRRKEQREGRSNEKEGATRRKEHEECTQGCIHILLLVDQTGYRPISIAPKDNRGSSRDMI